MKCHHVSSYFFPVSKTFWLVIEEIIETHVNKLRFSFMKTKYFHSWKQWDFRFCTRVIILTIININNKSKELKSYLISLTTNLSYFWNYWNQIKKNKNHKITNSCLVFILLSHERDSRDNNVHSFACSFITLFQKSYE